MKYKALFLDFYGTLVYEDDPVIAKITERMSLCAPSGTDPREIAHHWWLEIKTLCENSFGANFKTQRELEKISINNTLKHFNCKNADLDLDRNLFEYWIKPEICADSKRFLSENKLPVCVVSNIDRDDILQACEHHGLSFNNIVTSEDARSYKPRPEIFRMVLDLMGADPERTLHIGDSLSADVYGAHACGIDSFWLNRKRRQIPEGCPAAYIGETLLDLLKIL